MKRERIDLRDSFRAILHVTTESRELAVTAFMMSILFEGTDRDGAILLPSGKMRCIPVLPSRPLSAPAGVNLIARARGDRVIRTGEASANGGGRIIRRGGRWI